ncbi:MAG TPA: CAP domain-containing protein [Anaerolineae bacterium]|nr:CAP domain-containing protein [Anaerolineae bacterium]HUW95976.1 CAP domain-containing protein [Anaerolineae bacterium]
MCRLLVLLPLLAFFFLPSVAAAPEQTLLGLINDYRIEYGLRPLHPSPGLTEAARWMVRDMAEKDYFSHTDSLGRNPFDRMTDLGYDCSNWRSENLAAGSDDPQVIFQLWRDSPGHNANMLNAHLKVVGLAKAYDPDSFFGWYWAADFGGCYDKFWYLAEWFPPGYPFNLSW